MAKNKTISFTGSQLEKFLNNDGKHKDFPNWSFSSNTSDGEYDGEHGAMVDFPMYMHNNETDETYETTGGYYNEGAGECYDDSKYTFVLIRNVFPVVGKAGKKFFDVSVRLKISVDDMDEISHEDAEKMIKSLETDKFKVSSIIF